MRLRVRFSKVGKIRFIGHRDVARVMERAVRRIGLPVAYSKGFSPRMKLSFGLALPTGYESDAEFVELPLAPGGCEGSVIVGRRSTYSPCEQELPETAPSYCTIADALSEALPVGMDASAVMLSDGGQSLQAAIQWCGWQFEIVGLGAQPAQQAVADFLAADTVVTERVHKGETVSSNVRAGVGTLRLVGRSDRGAVLSAELSAAPRVVRPSELVPALAPTHEMGIARRTHQWTTGAAGRAEPAVPARCANRHKELISA
ncbi:TIGR03936 family radical SAM-associated protein [Candidatus Poriferisodalis sp.]|uniref:TIGR03936 family radical SAM-associated protein n=1 Tax=Candidatus Poriferisodalis sp. TaxID=3101277 RepID=UPI003B022FEC